MRTLIAVGLLVASESALAGSFEFGGLSLATTLQDAARRYPNSTISSGYVRVSPKDTPGHVFGIELFDPNLGNRLRIGFGSPDHRYPPCERIEKAIISRHGAPTEVREFREEAARNRHLTWQLQHETVHLQCFVSGGTTGSYAEAIAVYAAQPGPAPSKPGVQRTPAGQRP